MAKAKLYAASGEFKNEIDLPAVFDTEVNKVCIYLHIKAILNNRRQGTAQTKTRSQVSGGTTKPWKQKGTGRARQGSTRSPQWVHGGVALGPKPRSYRVSLNKKVKRTALFSALSSKVAGGEMVVIDKIATEEYKTKNMVAMLTAVGAAKKALIVLPEVDEKVIKSCANIAGVKTALYNEINVYDILNCDTFIVAKAAIEKIEEVYA